MTDAFLQGWKAQLDAALRLAETVTEAAMRMHEWTRGNAGKSLEYWRALLQAGTPEAPYNPWLGVLQQFPQPFGKTKT